MGKRWYTAREAAAKFEAALGIRNLEARTHLIDLAASEEITTFADTRIETQAAEHISSRHRTTVRAETIPSSVWKHIRRARGTLSWETGHYSATYLPDIIRDIEMFGIMFDADAVDRRTSSQSSHDGGTGDPGRPEKGTTLYVAEFDRRVAAKVIESTLIEEARQLLNWLKANHRDLPHPTEKTIANRIRAAYQRAKPHKNI